MKIDDMYIVRENKVFLPATKWSEERELSEFTELNKQNIIDYLLSKFSDVENEINDLKIEFDKSEDKIKLAGSVVRKKNYLHSAKAIGSYDHLFETIEKMETIIQTEIESNIQKKLELCNQVESLLESTEWKIATEKLKEIQKQFKEFQSVPDSRNDEIRAKFEQLIEEFFKRKNESFKHKDQEISDNISRKLEICEKAEAIQNSNDWKKTTETYAELNEEWKKVGVVPKHRNEELWFRFNTAKDIFFNNKKKYFEEIKTEQDQNLLLKLEIIKKAEAIKDSKEWKKTSDEFSGLMEEWKKIGHVVFEKSEEIWNQFLEIKNHFYQQKEAHFNILKTQLEDNYARKMAIVNHAEELQNSNEFEQGTQEFNNMFEEWRKIGRVPKEYGDEPWERFLKAKKIFFERKDENREKRREEFKKNYNEKVSKDRAFYNRISKELEREEDLLFDIEDRIKNLPATLRSYEKREELKEMIVGIKENIERLKAKAKDVKEKLQATERELNYVMRGPKKVDPIQTEKSETNLSDDKKETHLNTDESETSIN